VQIIRRVSGSVVTWRRAQMVLLSAQGMDAAAIAKVAFTSEDRVRDVIRNFNAGGFGALPEVPGRAAADARDLHPHRRGAASVRRL
jgi:transposase